MDLKNFGFSNLFKGKKNCVATSLLIASFFIMNICRSANAFGNFETQLIYYPLKKELVDVRLSLKDKLQDTYFYTLDGVKLNGWYIKAQGNKPTIIYCHGQGENISLWQSVIQSVTDKGYGMFLIDYRGHGRSAGNPTETGLYLDLESAVKYMREIEKIPQSNIVLWGRSLGGAVVADIASRDRFKGVILESTFTNIRDVAIHLTRDNILESKAGFWSGMASKFVKCMPLTQRFDTERKIGKIDSPLLIAGSMNDDIIPIKMSYDLAALNPKAQLYVSKTGSHHESEWFIDRAISFLDSLSGSQ